MSREFFLMDYEDLESNWNGRIRMRAMSVPDLDRAIHAVREFGEFVKFPAGHLDRLEEARREIGRSEPRRFEIELVQPIGAGMQVDLRDPAAPS
jgi:hypothetical protein